MKKIVFTLAVLLIAMPASAAVVITCTEDSPDSNGWVTISYDSSGEANVPRGFALDISVDGGASIIDVNDNITEHFTIHPWNIQISETGVLGDPGNAVAGAGEPGSCSGDSNCITIEMGSLYVGEDNEPPADGNLLRIQVDDNCTVSIVGNTLRGDIVLENVAVAEVDAPGCEVDGIINECMMATHPDYAAWDALGKPDCWCNRRQCRGDMDGLMEGPFHVSLNDLIAFRPCYGQMVTSEPCKCADFDHMLEGPFAVSLNDLILFRPNYGQMVITECDGTHINFWNN